MAVRRAFSNCRAERPVGPFNFFLPEQRALGKMVMASSDGEYGVEFDTISYYDFKEHLSKPPLSESHAIKQSLETLRNAAHARDIEGRERLAEVQNHLVDMLDYMEHREGYSLFPGDRHKCSTESRAQSDQAFLNGMGRPSRKP